MSMMQLPGRLIRDLRAAISQPTTMAGGDAVSGRHRLGDRVLPEEGDVAQAAAAVPAGQTWTESFRRRLGQAAAHGPRHAGRRRQGADRQVHRLAVPVVQGGAFRLQAVLEKFEKTHPGAVRQVIKDYPLNSKCNLPRVDEMHPAACEEAAAVRMARDKGKEKELVDWMFGMPGELQVRRTPDMVKAQAAQLLGVKDFDRGYAAKLPDIKRDVADGGALRVGQTPTLLHQRHPGADRPGLAAAALFRAGHQAGAGKGPGKSPQP